MNLAAAWLAASSTASSIDPLTLVNTAAQVAFLILFVTGRIVTGAALERERQRADRAEAALAKLNEQMTDKVIPALTLATKSIDQMTPYLHSERAIREAQWRLPEGS